MSNNTTNEELPPGWRRMSVGEVTTASDAPRLSDGKLNGKMPFIPMALLPEGGAATTTWELRSPQEIRSGVIFYEGDVLLAKITPCLENGKLAVARNIPGGWGMTSTEVYPLRATKVTSEFLALFLAQSSVRNALASKMQGATGRQRLPREALDRFLIPIPTPAEQHAIAHVLRTVQQTKATTEKVIAATHQLKQSLLWHLFTYGPVPFDQADRVKLKETEIGPVPKHWRIVALADIADLVSGGTPSTKRPDFWNGTIPWATPKDMKQPRLLDTEDHISEAGLAEGSRLVPAGTLFVVVRGMILSKDLPVAMATVPMAFNQDMKAILPSQEVNSAYLLYALMQFKRLLLPAIGTSAHGTRRIGTSAVNDWKVPLPSADEQIKIARVFEIVDRKLIAESERAKALDTLFQSLLHHLMTGKVRVHDLELPSMKEGAQ